MVRFFRFAGYLWACWSLVAANIATTSLILQVQGLAAGPWPRWINGVLLIFNLLIATVLLHMLGKRVFAPPPLEKGGE